MLFLFLSHPFAAWADPSIYGFTFPSWGTDAYDSADAQKSLTNMAGTGAKWVALIPTWYMKDQHESTLEVTFQTASDASVIHTIRQAKSLGMRVVLKPHVDCANGFQRALIKPRDASNWFREYRGFILRYARIAEQEHVDLFVIGTELLSMTTPNYALEWERTIHETRGIYSGKITYASTFCDFYAVPFWGSLDFIGVDAYFPLVGGKNSKLLALSWLAYRPLLESVSKGFGKPLLFTEIGISSQQGADHRPWNYHEFGQIDLDTQKAFFQAFLDVFSRDSNYAGFLQWSWDLDPNAGGPNDKSMTVQGKPALELLKGYFKLWNSHSPVPKRLALEHAEERALSVLRTVDSPVEFDGE